MTASAAIRWCAAVLLGLYAIVIAKLTLQPSQAEQGTFGLLDRVMTRVSDGQLDWSQTEILANIALFVPAGFLLTIVLGRAWLAAIACVLGSICIELAQQRYLPSRVPTIDDVQHNGLGGAIGSAVAWPIAYAIRVSARRALLPGQQPSLAAPRTSMPGYRAGP
jgi:glycopeptide antibiotics resistance protein